jgi:hypothetical protein
MGTNLSQVFISNTNVLEAAGGDGADSFNDLSTATAGIWSVDQYGTNSDNWINSKLFETTAAASGAVVDTSDAGAATDPVIGQSTLANPLWLYTHLQFAQGTANNPIASPIINTRNIRSVEYTPYQAFTGTKATIVSATLNVAGATDGDQYNFKFIIKSTPTDQLSFYDPAGLNIFGDFPLGAFNTTNHKAINMTVVIADVDDADAANNVSAVQDALADHPILGKMFTAADVGDDIVITAKHPGVVFDLIIENVTQDADPVDCNITGQVLGSGNDWQVIGEEIRCRSRYGNFNRMYLPQHMEAFGKKGFDYDKVVIEYEHNWPNSTGIAPAGALNQIVIYNTNNGTAPVVGDAGTDTFGDAFGYTIATAAKFVW